MLAELPEPPPSPLPEPGGPNAGAWGRREFGAEGSRASGSGPPPTWCLTRSLRGARGGPGWFPGVKPRRALPPTLPAPRAVLSAVPRSFIPAGGRAAQVAVQTLRRGGDSSCQLGHALAGWSGGRAGVGSLADRGLVGPDSRDPGARGPEHLGSPWRLQAKVLEGTLWFDRCSGEPCPAVQVAEHAPAVPPRVQLLSAPFPFPFWAPGLSQPPPGLSTTSYCCIDSADTPL